MNSEFDEQDVLDIVRQALEEGKTFGGPPMALSFGEGHLLETVSEKLSKYLNKADIQMFLDDLRDALYADVDIGDLKTLHSRAKNCKKCPAITSQATLPQWNLTDPDLYLLTDAPGFPKDALSLFLNTLKSTGWTSRRIALSYVNRCPVMGRKHDVNEINNCVPYLQTEIQLLKPKLIMPMGLIPSAAFLGPDINLGQERGKIRWIGPWAILPTYSPSHVVRGGGQLKVNFESDLNSAFEFLYGER